MIPNKAHNRDMPMTVPEMYRLQEREGEGGEGEAGENVCVCVCVL